MGRLDCLTPRRGAPGAQEGERRESLSHSDLLAIHVQQQAHLSEDNAEAQAVAVQRDTGKRHISALSCPPGIQGWGKETLGDEDSSMGCSRGCSQDWVMGVT